MHRSIRGASLAAALLGLTLPARAAPTDLDTTMVSYADVHLEVVSQGEGPFVLIIPSLGRGVSDYDDLADRLAAAGFHVVRAEPRGIGASSGPMSGLNLHDLADDSLHVIRAFGAKHVFVIGHGFGNRTARMIAADAPGIVKAVVLIDAGGKVKPDPAAADALSAAFDVTLPPDIHLEKVQYAFFAPGHDASAWRRGWYSATAQMERAASAATPLDQWWTAGDAPLLVIQGKDDRIALPANALALQKDAAGRAEVDYVDHAGHALVPEQPKLVADLIVAYLRKHS